MKVEHLRVSQMDYNSDKLQFIEMLTRFWCRKQVLEQKIYKI